MAGTILLVKVIKDVIGINNSAKFMVELLQKHIHELSGLGMRKRYVIP